MQMYTHVYIGLDAHTRNCVLGTIDADANVVSVHDFPTSETGLIRHVKALPATFKYLALEESSLAGWIAGVLTPHVTELIVCDPVQNALISRGGSKDDVRDSLKLARLLRLEELKPVYHNHDPSRVDFKIVAQQYLSITNEIVALKNQIKSKYYQGGVLKISGSLVYSKAHRRSYLKHVESEAMKKVILNFYDQLDCMVRVHSNASSLCDQAVTMEVLPIGDSSTAEWRKETVWGVSGSFWNQCIESHQLPMLDVFTTYQRAQRSLHVLSCFGEAYARFDPCPVKYPAKRTCNGSSPLFSEIFHFLF